jgi:enterochelin esterase family protein
MKKLFVLMSSLVFAVGAAFLTPRPATASPAPPVAAVEYGTFKSPSLGKDVSYAVSLPPSYAAEPKRRYPVVIFLHGMFNSEKDWEARGIQAALDQLRSSGKVGEYIVAIPRGENSFYINSKAGIRYEDAIVKDFIPFVDKTYRTTGSPKHRLIEGISMGGYGAMNIAFKYPDMFAGVATHCAALFIEPPGPPKSPDDRLGVWRYDMAKSLYGDPPDAAFFKANNPLDLAQANAAKIKKLKIYFDVGTEDRYKFDVGNKKLAEILTAAGVKHEFRLVSGKHGWEFLVAQSEPGFTFCWNAVK